MTNKSHTSSLKIALSGLGTVGCGLLSLLERHGDLIAQRGARPIEVVGVHAQNRSRARPVDLTRYQWIENLEDLASCGADVVVELMGGSDKNGPAYRLIAASLEKGIPVVTANKALLASHGLELAALAEKNRTSLSYEAAVAGGIPIIKSIKEGLAGNAIQAVYGILNGTCNYILTEMRTTGRDFADVLCEAQEKGYAEADPSFDVDGIDAAHKLSILTALAFGVEPDFESLPITGIRSISANDIRFAGELGYKIKLLGMANLLPSFEEGEDRPHIARSLEPCLVPFESAIGSVEGVFNAVYTEGDFVDKSMLEGRGAGAGPTASAVVSDLVDIARARNHLPTFGIPYNNLVKARWAEESACTSRYYLHLRVRDEAGVIADVSAILRDEKISIESMIQRGRSPGQIVSVVLTTHECSKKAMNSARERIATLGCVDSPPSILRMLDL